MRRPAQQLEEGRCRRRAERWSAARSLRVCGPRLAGASFLIRQDEQPLGGPEKRGDVGLTAEW